MNRLINRVNNKNISELLLNGSSYSKIYYTTTTSKKYKESDLKALVTSFKGIGGDLPYLILVNNSQKILLHCITYFFY